LNKLAAELDRFVDLGDIRLAGQLGGSAQWQQEAGDTLAASGRFNFRAFQLAMPGVMPWQEDDLAVSLQGHGIDLARYGIAAGKVSVLSGTDELNLVLEQGANADASQPLPVDVRLTGNLATWLPRLQAFVPWPAGKSAGR
jgi:translocation and assembly module TamB